ncbi:hypothetical protein P1S61_03065 [Streptomyces sp. ME08-AFT2]|uniref:hypothetical protein n=1 Tax=Streptomyces sp. ME08-AFT2 TaxID=3028683 RepID=UPI0029B24DB9|nr:hypothetical protein [Streptomyces sp. ME08-AFT2]MDX3308101.1 hypothetical protein [Streptomyces sp. ME08-AFT2]
MANRISTLISAFGVLASTMLLLLAVGEYRAGASVLWVGLGALILTSAVASLVRDVRRSRQNASA